MTYQEGLSLSEIDQRVKDLLLIEDDNAAHWDATERYRYINEAQGWVHWRVIRFLGEYETESHSFTMASGGSTYEVSTPAQMLRELHLFKKNTDRAGDHQWEPVRIIRPKEEDGWGNGSEEVWVISTGKLRARGETPPVGEYRLEYISLLPDLVGADDVCRLGPSFHEIVATRAAYRCSQSSSDETLANRLKDELLEWQREIEDKGKFLEGTRSQPITPRQSRDLSESSLFHLMERLRMKFGGSIPGDVLSRDRLRIALNEAQEKVQLILETSFETYNQKRWEFDMDGSAYDVAVPDDFRRHIRLEARSSSSSSEEHYYEVPIVRASDRNRYAFASPLVEALEVEIVPRAFTLVGNKLTGISSKEPIGHFRLWYEFLVGSMVADEDKCALPKSHHQAVVAYAARQIAAAYQKMDLVNIYAAEFAQWETTVRDDSRIRNIADNHTIHDDMGWGDQDGQGFTFLWS